MKHENNLNIIIKYRFLKGIQFQKKGEDVMDFQPQERNIFPAQTTMDLEHAVDNSDSVSGLAQFSARLTVPLSKSFVADLWTLIGPEIQRFGEIIYDLCIY